jgi:hypothetical protein
MKIQGLKSGSRRTYIRRSVRRALVVFAAAMTLGWGALARPLNVSSTNPPDPIFADGFDIFKLTVTNYLQWCSVSVNGEAPSVAATISETFPAQTRVPLNATPLVPFVWGYWTGTDPGGNDTSQATLVTMNADRDVLACCPFSGDTCHI